jgi:hypothetical protein
MNSKEFTSIMTEMRGLSAETREDIEIFTAFIQKK